ncbi:uncharacterized protein LOC143236024 [Tachypleus tridentatus]|uniref:uncharacterized protein LOC143236024 n=1 Tax=Tachypleus tridentatus TaxID=6853 RepID=UPI003FCFCA8C
MNKNVRETANTHEVLLSTSSTGVKFTDALTKQNICDHQIQNIYCAYQDPEGLNRLAYIVKEDQTNFHYCHAFYVKNVFPLTPPTMELYKGTHYSALRALQRCQGFVSTTSEHQCQTQCLQHPLWMTYACTQLTLAQMD